MWSLLMTIFIILNPNLRQPFQPELIGALPTEKAYKDILRQRAIPTSSEAYNQCHATSYQVLRDTFYTHFEYDPTKRITPSVLLGLIETALSAEISFFPLSNSQNSALEQADRDIAEVLQYHHGTTPIQNVENDGTNACAFFALGIIDLFHTRKKIDDSCTAEIEGLITGFPADFNAVRDVEKLYDVEEAYDILQKANLLRHKFIFREDFLEKNEIFSLNTYIKLKDDLLKLQSKAKEYDLLQFGIFQADKYIFSLSTSPDGSFYVFETHPIPEESHGNGNGIVVATKSCSELIQWLILRLVNSGVPSSATPFLVTVEAADSDRANVNIIPDDDDDNQNSSINTISDEDNQHEGISNEEAFVAVEDDTDDDDFEVEQKFYVNFESSCCKVSRAIWNRTSRISVEQLPNDINGLQVFNIKANDHEALLRACQDGRKWKPDSRTEWKGYTYVRYRDCFGSYICANNKCIYFQEYGTANSFGFNKRGVCKYCGGDGAHIKCSARKYTAFCTDTEADVYHYGTHNCGAKGIFQRPSEIVHAAISNDINIKPSKIQSNKIISLLRNRTSWDDIDKMIEQTSCIKKISNEKVKQMKIIQPKEGFDALVDLKAFTDQKDRFIIYEVDENKQIIFKTSLTKMKLASSMDILGTHYLGQEYCNFDGTHKRAIDFITLTASVYHPLLEKQVVLATMQCKHENEVCVTLFWELFNKAYKEVNGDEKQFNPIGFCSDMAGANFSSLRNVFGVEVLERVQGCGFHFKQNYEKQMRSMESTKAVKFEELSKDLLNAMWPAAYNAAYTTILSFITSNQDLLHLLHWLGWWHDRKYLMFRAFTPIDAPNSNLAEVIHAGWKNKGDVRQSILACAYSDITETLNLDEDLKKVQMGTYDGGRGPSQPIRKLRKLASDVQKAGRIGQELLDYSDYSMVEIGNKLSAVHENSGHAPQPKRKSRSKLFSNRLENARKSKYIMKIVNVEMASSVQRRYEVISNVNSRSSYEVHVCSQPSCTCPDYKKFGSDVPCKHILFVLLFALEVSDLNILEKTYIAEDDVKTILSRTDVDKLFMHEKPKKKASRSKASLQEILKSHPNFNDPQICTLHHKKSKSAKCSGHGCKQVFQIGAECLKIEEALTVPFNQDIVVKQTFYFCPSARCIRNTPAWSNVRHPTVVLKESDISDETLAALQKEIESNS